MYLIYLDGSGGDEHTNFVLGGVAVFEGEIRRHLENMEVLMERHFPGKGQETELHITELRKKAWGGEDQNFTKSAYNKLMDDAADMIANEQARHGMVLFATVVHKPSLTIGNDPYIAAFENIVNRVDLFLVGQHKAGQPNKGILILDREGERRTEQLQQIYNEFRKTGHRWGTIYNLPEIPFFANSTATRMLQMADYIAHVVFQRYESSFTRQFDKILRTFHQADGVIHGLTHIIGRKESCMCPACVSRKRTDRHEI